MFAACAALLAQDEQAGVTSLVGNQPDALSSPDPLTPLTLKQNYMWSLRQIVDPGRFFVVAAKAAIDHSENDPTRWGQGTEGYSIRVASLLGRAAIRENVAFAVRALDGEDPRYFRSQSKGFVARAAYAVGRTFIARSASGGTMPAYSVLAASFGTPLIADTWRPEPMTLHRELRAGGMAIGIDAAGNVCREFWPDIRKRLRR